MTDEKRPVDQTSVQSPEEIAENINRSISELIAEGSRPSPEGHYNRLSAEKVPEPAAVTQQRRLSENRNRIMVQRLLTATVALAVVLVILSVVVLFSWTQQSMLARNKILPSLEEADRVQSINSVVCKVTAATWNRADSTLTLELAVENKGNNDLYLTLYGFTLLGENGQEYLPDLAKSEASAKFYGQKIAPKASETASVVFQGIPTNTGKWTLIIRNVADTMHFAWDYAIVLPEISEIAN